MSNKFNNKIHKFNFGDKVSHANSETQWTIRMKVTTQYLNERGDVMIDATYGIRSCEQGSVLINDVPEALLKSI